jgi:hypothetical protein
MMSEETSAFRQLSSVVEQRFCKPSVVGSNPTAGSIPALEKQLLEDLTELELRQLRDTLCDRKSEHKPETLERRRSKRALAAVGDPN